DGGRGMVAHPDSPGAGLGVPLMLRIADGLLMSSEAAGQGTCVHGTFERAIAAPAPAARELLPEDDRRTVLWEYLRVLEKDNAALVDDAEALRAEAQQARRLVARARSQRRERSLRSR